MICRQCCINPAVISIRSGFENHPTCADCAEWWNPDRRESIDCVESDYYQKFDRKEGEPG